MTGDRSISELTRDVALHMGDMLRNELKLARTEATESIRSLLGATAMMACGIAFGAAAITLALISLALGLATIMPGWAAALVSALLGGVVAIILVQMGKTALEPSELTLPKTRDQVARDIKNVAEHVG